MRIQWIAPTVRKALDQEPPHVARSHSVKTAPEGASPYNTDADCNPRRWSVSGSVLKEGHGKAKAGLVFLTVRELITAPRVPILLGGSQESQVNLVNLHPSPEGGWRSTPAAHKGYPSGPSRTLRFLSYALRRATPTRGSACLARPPTPTPPSPICAQRLPYHTRPALVPTGNCAPAHNSTHAVCKVHIPTSTRISTRTRHTRTTPPSAVSCKSTTQRNRHHQYRRAHTGALTQPGRSEPVRYTHALSTQPRGPAAAPSLPAPALDVVLRLREPKFGGGRGWGGDRERGRPCARSRSASPATFAARRDKRIRRPRRERGVGDRCSAGPPPAAAASPGRKGREGGTRRRRPGRGAWRGRALKFSTEPPPGATTPQDLAPPRSQTGHAPTPYHTHC